MKIKKIIAFTVLSLICTAGQSALAKEVKEEKQGSAKSLATSESTLPNIIVIMSDDHATNAISAYGGRLKNVFKTPNIDRLAKGGVR